MCSYSIFQGYKAGRLIFEAAYFLFNGPRKLPVRFEETTSSYLVLIHWRQVFLFKKRLFLFRNSFFLVMALYAIIFFSLNTY